MKYFLILLLCSFTIKAQEIVNDTIKNGISIDSLKENVNLHKMRFNDLDEKVAIIESDLSKLTKIKFSGYIQAQYEMYNFQDDIGPEPSTTAIPIKSKFLIRRARVKLTYEPITGAAFVIQPDYAFDKVTLRDAYVQLNDRWIQTFKLFVGQFNRICRTV